MEKKTMTLTEIARHLLNMDAQINDLVLMHQDLQLKYKESLDTIEKLKKELKEFEEEG